MQSQKESATVPVALFGVSPNSSRGRFHSSFGASGRLLPARRRDADGSGRDDRAPHLQLHRSGSDTLRSLLALAAPSPYWLRLLKTRPSTKGVLRLRLASLNEIPVSTVRRHSVPAALEVAYSAG